MEHMLQPQARRPPSRSRNHEQDYSKGYRPRFSSPKMNYNAREPIDDQYSEGDSRQYTSVWKKFDVQRPFSGQIRPGNGYNKSIDSRGMPYLLVEMLYNYNAEEKRGFMPPKHSLSHFKQNGGKLL